MAVACLRRTPARAFFEGRGFLAQLLAKMPIKQTLTRAERNRRAMNGMPMDAPRSLIRKSSERNPMIDLEAADGSALASRPQMLIEPEPILRTPWRIRWPV